MLPALFAAGALIYGGKKLFDYLTSSADQSRHLRKNKAASKPQIQIIPNKATYKPQIQIVPREHGTPQHQNDPAMAEVNTTLTASYMILGATAAGKVLYPPLASLGAAGLGFLAAWEMFEVYKKWRRERKVGIELINSILMVGLLATGYTLASACVTIIYYSGRKFLLKAQQRNKHQLAGLFQEQQQAVWLLRDGVEIQVQIETLLPGDVISVRAGEIVPVDGMVTSGQAAIDQRMLTGESQPVEKAAGDRVLASTLLIAGKLYIRVEQAGQKTVAANLEALWQQTIDFKTSVQSKGEQLSDKAVVPTLALSAAALPIAGPLGSLAVLSSYVGYDIRIFAPLSMVNFMQVASENGILIKDGRAMELLQEVDTVVFDKTGTLTLDMPHVWQTHTCSHHTPRDILFYAAIAETRQTHPIAKAILRKAKEDGVGAFDSAHVRYDAGYGICVTIGHDLIRVGSARFMRVEGITIPVEMDALLRVCQAQGYALVMVAKNERLIGAVELHTTVRPEAATVIRKLKARRKQISILSGDYEQVAKLLAEDLGIEHYVAEVFPEQKAAMIEQLQREGKKVCYVGDGINDAIAMKKANVSVSLSGAASIATDSADIILLDGTLNKLDTIFDLAEEIDENLQTAMISAIVPGVFNIGSVFLLGTGIISALLVSYTGFLFGIGNGLRPLLAYRTEAKDS